MNLDHSPIWHDLDASQRESLMARAEMRHVDASAMLFREGDTADTAYILTDGTCMLSQAMQPLYAPYPGEWLDLLAVLGGLPHTMTAITTADCDLLCWPVAMLWDDPAFASAARQYLADSLLKTQTRLDELQKPVHYTGSAGIAPGPFWFDNVTMLVALCDADLDSVHRWLPDGLSLLRRPGRGQGSVFLALAQFPDAYPENRPQARFAYDETTCFVPVRFGANFGLYVPFIYPSTWEPILLGREIYGFPKRLGKTTFSANAAALTVDETPYFRLAWESSDATSEPRLVRALSDWIGIEGRATETAFRAGEIMRQAMRLPPYRRIEVYNHKCILAADATADQPRYDVNGLTRAAFGVTRWHQIAQMQAPQLSVTAGPLRDAGLILREGYITRLDMRLSVGEMVLSYT